MPADLDRITAQDPPRGGFHAGSSQACAGHTLDDRSCRLARAERLNAVSARGEPMTNKNSDQDLTPDGNSRGPLLMMVFCLGIIVGMILASIGTWLDLHQDYNEVDTEYRD